MSSATLDSLGALSQYEDVVSFLFGTSTTATNVLNTADSWDNDDWGWGDEYGKEEEKLNESSSDANQEKQVVEPWLQKCIVGHSPVGDLIVLANQQRAMFFKGEWNEKSCTMKFVSAFKGSLSQDDGETISAILCIPLVSNKKSSPGAPDWSCVIVGFSSGQVRMYTEDGKVLVDQKFHTEPVVHIKCQSYQPAFSAVTHDQLEEIFILYQTVIVTLEGFGLFQTLRACRNHLARLHANATDAAVTPPPLSFKKWQYEHGKPMNDSESVGMCTPSTFDHLHTGSLLGGFHAKCKNVPSTSMIFVSAGKKPYIAFNYAQEGHAIPVLTEIAFAVASKLKTSILNAASGWLGFGGGSKGSAVAPKEQPHLEPAASMSMRFGLVDFRRAGRSVLVSPCRKLTVVTDMLGRVSLIDNQLGIMVRMWKGYRDAQCGWLQVTEKLMKVSRKENRSTPKEALFLVVYAPRLGLVEVFAMQQGPKVASFSVTKSGRLLSVTYGMMGLNNIPLRGGNKPCLQCVFVGDEGKLFALNVPFHLAICDRTNTKVKDMHLLKTLQKILKSFDDADKVALGDEIFDILKEIKIPSMVHQGFKILCHRCKDAQTFRNIIQRYLETFCDDGDKDLSLVFRLQSLVEYYEFLLKIIQEPPEYSKIESDSDAQTLLRCLHSSDEEMKVLDEIAKLYAQSQRDSRGVKFQDDLESLALNDFFVAFKIDFDVHKSRTRERNSLELNEKFEYTQAYGSFMFCGVMNNSKYLREWKMLVQKCSLSPAQVMSIAFRFWCEHKKLNTNYVGLMQQLYNILRAVSELDSHSVSLEFGRVNSWWEDVRRNVAKSSKIFHIYSFSIVCRAAAIDLQIEAEKSAKEVGIKKKEEAKDDADCTTEDNVSTTESILDSEEWENMSIELMRWNLLLKQIEDLSILTTVLNQKPVVDVATLPVLPNTINELSVLNLLDKGKGCIAELVGKWLTTIGVDPVHFTDDALHGTVKVVEAPASPELNRKERKRQRLMEEKLGTVTKTPEVLDNQILEAGVEVTKSFNGITAMQDLIRYLLENFSISLSSSIILANYSWEYCLEWNKDTNATEFLEAGIKCAIVIPSSHIKHGIMLMMWTTFMSKKFAACVATTRQQEKVFEKLTGFGSVEKEEIFLKSMVTFFENLMEVNVSCESSEHEEHAQQSRELERRKRKNHWSQDASSASLTDLATKQRSSSYEMLLLHYQLSIVAYFACKYKIKKQNLKPSLLFDTQSRMMLFQDLSTPFPSSHSQVDLALKKSREEFMRTVIQNSIYEITEDPSAEEKIIPSPESVQESSYWINHCLDLGRMWGLDADLLRIHQICTYYSCGFDLLGLENISSVNAKEVLGSKLLTIAGMRVNFILDSNSSSNVTELLSAFSTNLSNWLKSLDYTELRCLRFPRVSVPELAQELLHLIPESSYDHALAEELSDASNFL